MRVEVEDLCVARGGLPVLSGVRFSVDAGQALVLRGPNGSGKTTLLRTLAGLQAPLSGQMRGLADRVAYGGHADGVKAMLRVSENLRFWADIFGYAGGVDAAMEAYGLTALAPRFAGQLSAGQKRRLGLARMLVTGQPIWIMDEPTVSLDTASVAQFGAAVQAHLAAGGSAIMATHIDLGFPAEVLDVSRFAASVTQAHGASDEAFL